jgi:hypothetical protein
VFCFVLPLLCCLVMSSRLLSSLAMCCLVLCCLVLCCLAVSSVVLSCLVWSCLIMYCPQLSYIVLVVQFCVVLVWCRLVLSCRYPVLSCLVLFCLVVFSFTLTLLLILSLPLPPTLTSSLTLNLNPTISLSQGEMFDTTCAIRLSFAVNVFLVFAKVSIIHSSSIGQVKTRQDKNE